MDIPTLESFATAAGEQQVELTISVVVPAYNEEAVLGEFYRRTVAVLSQIGAPFELVFVNDGSRDGTLRVLHELRAHDPRVVIVDLSRNFGKEIAMTAGLDHAAGEVVVVIDADLQDPPELIEDFVAAWREGYDVVYAVRTVRDGETWLKKATASLFYRLMGSVSRIEIPRDTGDFRLMSRRAVDALGKLREQHRFMKGLFAWVGFPSKPVYYRRDPRHAGETSFNYVKLWNLAVEGFTSFTIAPLKVATYTGLFIAFVAFVYAAYVVYKTLRYGDPVQGYPSLMTVVLFLGGVQLVFTGIIGEYLGRVFNEVKGRPLYLTKEVTPSVLRGSVHRTNA
jgi:glycosyltransferase involved in cell wall biosynthesis